MDGIYLEVLLTLLTIITGTLTILTFLGNKKKDAKNDGTSAGQIQSDLIYIKNILVDLKSEFKDIKSIVDAHSERLARIEESTKQAHKRIDEIERGLKNE